MIHCIIFIESFSMPGDRFVRYLKPVAPRNLPKLNLFLDYLAYKTEDSKMRAAHITPNGYGSRLLVAIIKLADLDVILKFDHPSKLVNHLSFILKDLEKLIDVRTGKHTTHNLFIKSRQPCFELISPSRRQIPLLEIPFSNSYAESQWTEISPLRVNDMCSCDLKFSVHTDYFHFNNRGPTHVLYSLDCMALVAKFVAYYKYTQSNKDLEQTLLDFVHNEIIVPSLLRDTVAVWMRNSVKQQFITDSPLSSYTSTVGDNITTDTVGSDFNGAMLDLVKLKEDLINQSITAQTALSSVLLTSDKLSFSKYFIDLNLTTSVPKQQPYIWVECLKNIAWWEFIITMTSHTPSHPDAVSLQRDVLRDIRLWCMLKPWQEIHSSIPLKTMVRNRLEGMLTYLSSV